MLVHSYVSISFYPFCSSINVSQSTILHKSPLNSNIQMFFVYLSAYFVMAFWLGSQWVRLDIQVASLYLPNSVHFTFSLFLNKSNVSFVSTILYVSERSWVGVCFLIGSLLANTKILASKSQTFHSSFSLKTESRATDWS